MTHCFTVHAFWAEWEPKSTLELPSGFHCLSIQSLNTHPTSIHPPLNPQTPIQLLLTADSFTLESVCGAAVVREFRRAVELISNAAERNRWLDVCPRG